MKVIAACLVVLASSSAFASPPSTLDPHYFEIVGESRPGVGMRRGWGSSNTFELTGRYEYAATSEWLDLVGAVEVGGASMGGRRGVIAGAGGEVLWFHIAGLGVGMHVLRMEDALTGNRYVGRASVGVRLHGLEVNYAYQRQLHGSREDWMPDHLLTVGLHVPLRFDF
jgi:hypothetical protein